MYLASETTGVIGPISSYHLDPGFAGASHSLEVTVTDPRNVPTSGCLWIIDLDMEWAFPLRGTRLFWCEHQGMDTQIVYLVDDIDLEPQAAEYLWLAFATLWETRNLSDLSELSDSTDICWPVDDFIDPLDLLDPSVINRYDYWVRNN